MAIGLPLLLLLPVAVLGGLAAVVFGIVYAIVNKKPKVAIVALAVPIALVVGVGLLATLFAVRMHRAAWNDQHAHVSIVSNPGAAPVVALPPLPALPAVPALPPVPPMNMSGEPANWLKVAIVVLICVGLVKFFRRSGSGSDDGRSRWGKVAAVVAVGILVAMFVNVRVQYSERQEAQQQQQIATARLQQTIEANRVMEDAQRHANDTQRRLAAEAQEAANRLIQGGEIQKMWEKLNESRIKLDDNGFVNPPTAADGAATATSAATSSESLSRSVAQLEQTVRQVSELADQVSDAGTLLGRALVALRERLDAGQKAVERPTAQTAAAEPVVKLVAEAKAAETTATMSPPEPAAVPGEHPAAEEVQTTVATATVAPSQPSAGTDEAPPTWIDDPPQRFGNTWREVVVTDEYATAEECARAADVLLLFKTYQHFSELLGNPRTEDALPSLSFDTKTGTILANGNVVFEPRGEFGAWRDYRLNTLANMGIGIDFVRREIVPQHREFYQTEERSFGPMKKLYTMLEFSPSVDAELMRRFGDLRRQDRFAMVGVGAGSVLGLIGLVFGLLKVDTWTRGYYTKRLFFGVPAAIIALIALLGLAAGS